MKNGKTILFAIILISLLGAGHAIIEYIKKSNRKKYNATKACENVELEYCKAIFNIGDSYSVFEKKREDMGIAIFREWKNEDTRFIKIKDVLKECPLSGRPYCGIIILFKQNKLTNISAGYPCH
ncbi:hypothetical protein [Flagellimonas onchidii]|uniref:hypothetical protein n=1 Tax=Flagellimonas onchidii TaxID=2562684 RepID=UPI0010A5A71D|nr:hypothetical protein [Allomuricauda onchidii]